ncbi:hypothetical protein H4V95_002286 [Arthrobacter sp. CAN_C5]|nr:hypothetical protein [Arthrobacter sp. CAN_C5]
MARAVKASILLFRDLPYPADASGDLYGRERILQIGAMGSTLGARLRGSRPGSQRSTHGSGRANLHHHDIQRDNASKTSMPGTALSLALGFVLMRGAKGERPINGV